MNVNAPMKVAIAGTGWRSEFYIRICEALPQYFKLCGIMYHSEKGRASVAGRNVPLVDSLDALAALRPDYIVLSLNGAAMPAALRFCAERGIPALCETFGADSVDGLNCLYADIKNARIQFAEQYQFQPEIFARLALMHTGLMGNPYYVRMSIPTRYHPVSLIRLALGKGQQLPVISARRYTHDALKGPGRDGDPAGEIIFSANQDVVMLDYGDAQGVNDFEAMQYNSFMHKNTFQIRGSRGEIYDECATYMEDAVTPCTLHIERVMTGAGLNLEGEFLRGVRAGQLGWLYSNRFMPARLFDDELAVAACMAKMNDYVAGGKGFYGADEEFTDMYFALISMVALESGDDIHTSKQSWM